MLSSEELIWRNELALNIIAIIPFKIHSDMFANIHIFGANDQDFHLEFERPLIAGDVTVGERCGSDDVSEKIMATFGLDYTQFSPWLRKEFIRKV